jgi:mono/diheme cytochrome c family protein
MFARQQAGGRGARFWTRVMAVTIIAVLALAGCGRVNLEDLTPEAFRTEEAARQATAAAMPTNTPGPAGTPGSGSGSGSGGGQPADLAAGEVQYNTWCAGCHDSGRAPVLKGRQFDFAEIEQVMRTGQGFAQPHPSYSQMEITNRQFNNILAYIASASP